MSNIQTGAERMQHDLSHLGFLAGQIGRLITISTTPVIYHDGGYYTVKDCVTIDVLPRTPGNNVYVGFMVWSNFTATKCRGLVSLNQVIKEIICLQPLK